MEKSIEPKHGYLTEQKAEYRRNIYKEIGLLLGDSVKDKKLLFLPHTNDEEIKEALLVGFREENMYACNDNAAILATSAWRKNYPNINIFGSRLGRAIERLRSDGIVIDVANLDLCTNISQEMFNDISALIRSNLNRDMVIGLTLLKGRESAAEATLARMLYPNIDGTINRIKIVLNYIIKSFRVKGKIILNKEYKSGNQVMCYGLFHIVNIEYIEKCNYDIFDELLNKVDDVLKIDNELRSLSTISDYVDRENNFKGQSSRRDKEYIKELSRRVAMRDSFLDERAKLKQELREKQDIVSFRDYDSESREYICAMGGHVSVRKFIEMENTPCRRL